jgi:ubiquinone biosynthesis monooxygenase Coq7
VSVDALKIATGRVGQDATLERMVRVDHAGEYGAKRIYEGQLRVLGTKPCGETIRHMRDQELEHLDYFEKQVRARGARPTAMMPFWHIGGYALGAVTALMGEKAAMACTVAVESVIDAHYGHQLETLKDNDDEHGLVQHIEKFKAEEMEHHDIGLEHGAAQMPAYGALVAGVSAITKSAIWLSKRV